MIDNPKTILSGSVGFTNQQSEPVATPELTRPYVTTSLVWLYVIAWMGALKDEFEDLI